MQMRFTIKDKAAKYWFQIKQKALCPAKHVYVGADFLKGFWMVVAPLWEVLQWKVIRVSVPHTSSFHNSTVHPLPASLKRFSQIKQRVRETERWKTGKKEWTQIFLARGLVKSGCHGSVLPTTQLRAPTSDCLRNATVSTCFPLIY